MPKVTIDLDDLVELQTKAVANLSDQFNMIIDANISAAEAIADFRRQLITETLKRTGGNVSKAARLLAVKVPTLHNWITKYKIDVE